MKKGVQYSHYCGLELLEIINSIHLSMDLVDENREKSIEWAKYALKMTSQLRDKIAELDILNKMEY